MPEIQPVTFLDLVGDPDAPSADQHKVYAKTGGLYYRTASDIKRLLDEDDSGGAAFWMEPVQAATVAPVTMSTDLDNGSVLDGETLVTGQRVLVKDQDATDPSQNGIYIVAASGTPTRASDMPSVAAGDIGKTVLVKKGTRNEGTYWYVNQAVTAGDMYWRSDRQGDYRVYDDTNQSYGPGDTTLNTVVSHTLWSKAWRDAILELVVAGTFTNNTGATRTFRWLLSLDGQTVFDETSGAINSSASTREWGLRVRLMPISSGIWLVDAQGMVSIAPATPFAATTHAQELRMIKRWAPGTPPSGDAVLAFQVQGQSGAGMSYTKRGHTLYRVAPATETGL